MTADKNMAWSFGKEQWFAEFVRATIFYPESIKVQNAETWWETCVRANPDEISRKPAIAQTTITGSTADKNYACILACAPDRVDWNLLKTTAPESKSADRPHDIGPIQDAASTLLDILSRWAGLKVGPCSRIAFGTVLHLPVPSKEESYGKLSEMLHTVKIDPVNSSDFIYRINRPIQIKLSGITITVNRLALWSSLSGYPLTIAAGPTMQIQHPMKATATYNAARLELDINTKPDPKVTLPGEDLPKNFVELIEVARKLSGEGDK